MQIHNNPWDAARKLRLQRINPLSRKMEKIDPGVNFFLLALEMLGASTLFSCEGHPYGFYVLFTGEYALAKAIADVGWFNVQIESNGEDRWSMRLLSNERMDWSDDKRIAVLRNASEAWVQAFPKLAMLGVPQSLAA